MSKQNKEIVNLTPVELAKRTRDLEGKMFQTRMQKATGQLQDTALIWRQRKELARLKTQASVQAHQKHQKAEKKVN